MTLMITHHVKLIHVHISPERVGFHLYQKVASHSSTVFFCSWNFPFSLDLGKIMFWTGFEPLILCALKSSFF